MRSLRGHGPPPTASPSDALHRIRKRVPPSRTHPGQPTRLDCVPLSLPPSLELAPRAGRFREVVSASGRSGSGLPALGMPCRIGFAALCLSGKQLPILAMAPRVTGSMIARLSAWLHVCLFARWHTRPDGHQAACKFAYLPVCMPGYLPAFARQRIGKAHAWRATTSPSKRSNAAPGGQPRRRRPIGQPLL